MKVLLIIFTALICYSHGQDFQYCEFEEDLNFFWPDWSNSKNFVQCLGILNSQVHTCVGLTHFSFVNQVKNN